MHPISVCIIAKNEEARIEKCLASIKPCGFEIVVVDTGSTDRTKEIAARYADKLLDFEWCDDFSAARNFSLREASNNWIFMIDCDETVKEIDVEELNYFRKHLSENVGSVSRENLVTANGVLTLNNTDYTERFFNKKLYHYTGMIHEQLTPIRGHTISPLLLHTTLLHTGYDMTPEEREAKYRRNFTLLEKQVQTDPENPYLYYQLGKSCEILGDYARACTYYDKGLEFDLDPELAYVQAMVVSYGNALLHSGQAETALGLAGVYDEFSSVTDFIYLMGNIYKDNGMPEQALEQYQKALQMPPGRQNGVNSFLPQRQCELILKQLKETEDTAPAAAPAKLLSVCIIGKNEEQHIERCLSPLRSYPFEIVYVDTGSTDRTKEIAAQYADAVYDFAWCDDFSAARNFALQQASHDHVLFLDCDEYLTALDTEALRRAMEAHPQDVGLLLRNNYYESNGSQTNYPDRVERLFSRRFFHYKGVIHEQVVTLADDSPFYESYDIPLTVDHLGYSSRDAREKKAERNNALLFQEIEKNPDDPYLYFQVGQSYNGISDYENAYLYYKKSFALPFNPAEGWVAVMATAYINAMNHTGRSGEALAFFTPLYAHFEQDANFYCSMGNAYLNADPPQPLRAMTEYLKALQCPSAREEGANSFLPYYNIGLVNEMLGKTDAAFTFYQKAADLGFTPAVEKLKNRA